MRNRQISYQRFSTEKHTNNTTHYPLLTTYSYSLEYN